MKPDVRQLAQSGATDGQVLVWSDALGLWVPGSLAAPYTSENARDDIGAALVAGTKITIAPNDGANTITIAAPAVGAKVYMSTSLSAASGGYLVPWDSEEFDTEGLHDNVTNNTRLTLTRTGLWACGYDLAISVGITSAVRFLGGINKNGTEIRGSRTDSPVSNSNGVGNSYPAINASTVISATSGDYLTVSFYQDTGSAMTLDRLLCSFWAMYLG